VRPLIRSLLLPPEGEAHTKNLHPLDVVRDTRHIKVQDQLAGKPVHELEIVYNVAAWLQLVHNQGLMNLPIFGPLGYTQHQQI